MTRTIRQALTILTLLPLASTVHAQAQARRTGPTQSVGGLANPQTTPMINPYMNPYLMSQPLNRDAALLYLLAAQRESGGIGSGMLGGPGSANKPRAVAEVPRSAMRPGGGAARYFGRGPSRNTVPAGAYRDRHERYFGNNGR